MSSPSFLCFTFYPSSCEGHSSVYHPSGCVCACIYGCESVSSWVVGFSGWILSMQVLFKWTWLLQQSYTCLLLSDHSSQWCSWAHCHIQWVVNTCVVYKQVWRTWMGNTFISSLVDESLHLPIDSHRTKAKNADTYSVLILTLCLKSMETVTKAAKVDVDWTVLNWLWCVGRSFYSVNKDSCLWNMQRQILQHQLSIKRKNIYAILTEWSIVNDSPNLCDMLASVYCLPYLQSSHPSLSCPLPSFHLFSLH